MRALYDSNDNGLLDAGDARWNDFLVWQDRDQNAVSAASELTSLSASGIRDLALTPDTAESRFLPDGTSISGTSSYTKADGSSGLAADVSFAISQNPAIIGDHDDFFVFTVSDPETNASSDSGPDDQIIVSGDDFRDYLEAREPEAGRPGPWKWEDMAELPEEALL